MSIAPTPVRERLMAKVMPEPNSGCWLWLGVVRNSGYGLIGVGSDTDRSRTMRSVHRVSYEEFVGTIPDGLMVCHKCDVKTCVNPDHLFLGTQRDNMADKLAKGRHHYGARSRCKNGHEFTSENTRSRNGSGRVCRACQRDGYQRHIERKKGE